MRPKSSRSLSRQGNEEAVEKELEYPPLTRYYLDALPCIAFGVPKSDKGSRYLGRRADRRRGYGSLRARLLIRRHLSTTRARSVASHGQSDIFEIRTPACVSVSQLWKRDLSLAAYQTCPARRERYQGMIQIRRRRRRPPTITLQWLYTM